MSSVYGTVDGWIAYAAMRGDTAPSAAPTPEAHLQVGSDYIRIHYVIRFAPQVDTTATDVAAALEEAAYLAASLDLAKPGSLSGTFIASDQKTSTKAGDLSWEARNHEGASALDLAMIRSTAIDRLLAPYLAAGVDTTQGESNHKSAYLGVTR